MMSRKRYKAVAVLLCFFSLQLAVAQTVPDRIEFAGLEILLTKKAKARIQADVDMIKKNATYFQQKVDRANLFFPVIEKVFAEEGFPSEFKYLALQESSLVSDAVSSSQAVGYWQFKKESAVEVGVKVDHRVDERMNIYASSKGAAKYLKRNQAVLNNWIYTLLSYNMGLGGVKSQVNNEYVGAQQMEIDEDMHWYVFRFLAHKIAYEGMVGNAHHSSLHLVGYKLSEQKKLQDIAKETALDEQLVLDYNKWCLHKEVPGDREYIVILPVPVADREQYIAKYEKGNTYKPVQPPVIVSQEPVHGTIVDKQGVEYTAIDEVPDWTKAPMRVSINRVKAVRIAPGDDIHTITLKTGISKEGFLRFNEITASHQLITGNYYYLQLKRLKALVPFHVVKKGESTWSIAQHYGIKQSAILSKNRMDKHEALKEGRVLWLRDKRPKETPIEYKKVEEIIKPLEVKETTVTTPIPTNDTTIPVLTEPLPDYDKYIYHVVKQGETMFGISRSYYVSSDSILHWNGMTDYSIKTGQNLIVGRKIKNPPVKHVVKQGETLYKISQLYNIDVNTILKNNNKTEASIKIGEELIISQ